MIFENKLFQTEDAVGARRQAWAMSIVCVMLTLFAAAAATRIPEFLGTNDYVNLIGVSLFIALVLIGLIGNIAMHIALHRPKDEQSTLRPRTINS